MASCQPGPENGISFEMGPAGETGAAGGAAAVFGAGFCAADCAITVNGRHAATINKG